MTSNYVPGLRLEFARFYGETGHFKLNFSVENSNFSQFFVSGIHIHTFFHNFAEKKISFHRHFKFDLKMAALGLFSPLKNQHIPMHPIWSIHIG